MKLGTKFTFAFLAVCATTAAAGFLGFAAIARLGTSASASLSWIASLGAAGLGLALSLVLGAALARSLRRDLGAEPAELARVAALLAKGDVRIEFERESELGVYADVRAAAERAGEALASLQDASVYASCESERIADATRELFQGRARQLSCAKELGAVMAELGASTRKSFCRAESVEGLSRSSNEAAARSAKALKEAVAKMHSIANGLAGIEELTRGANLLAMETSIDAAKSGLADIGFCLALGKVQKMARRAEQSAVEMTSLAAAAVQLAELSSAGLEAALPDLRRSAEFAQDLGEASRDQADGVRRATESLARMDGAIKQGAGAAEELAAAADYLAEDTDRLAKTLARFRFDAENPDVAPSCASGPQPQPVESPPLAAGQLAFSKFRNDPAPAVPEPPREARIIAFPQGKPPAASERIEKL